MVIMENAETLELKNLNSNQKEMLHFISGYMKKKILSWLELISKAVTETIPGKTAPKQLWNMMLITESLSAPS